MHCLYHVQEELYNIRLSAYFIISNCFINYNLIGVCDYNRIVKICYYIIQNKVLYYYVGVNYVKYKHIHLVYRRNRHNNTI